MSIAIVGVRTEPWCSPDGLTNLGGTWSIEGRHVVCNAPGIYVVRGKTRFVLPRCYVGAQTLHGAGAIRAALRLLSVLNRYRKQAAQRSVHEATQEISLRECGDIIDTLTWVESGLLLFDDAAQHGPIMFATPQLSPKREGRIHWGLTQQRGAHVVDGAEVVTSPLWRSRFAINPEDPLTRLHADTCSAIRAQFGLGTVSTRIWTPPEAIAVLDQREHAIYMDRHRRVVGWLRQYWQGRSGALDSRTSAISAVWSPSFPLVWEAMVGEVLRGRRFWLPRGTYHLDSGGMQTGLRLVPDFVVDVDGKRLIVDAKHYGLDDLPETQSIAKQLLYRWYASSESGHGDVPLAAIQSVFMLPSVGYSSIGQTLGWHELDPVDGAADVFSRVHVVAADF
jgi:hypothetical protein